MHGVHSSGHFDPADGGCMLEYNLVEQYETCACTPLF